MGSFYSPSKCSIKYGLGHYEQIVEAQKHYQDSIALVERIKELEREKAEQAELAEFEKQKSDTTNLFFNVLNGKEETVVLSNDKVNVNISTYGSRVTSVSLKDYKNQNGGDVVLFDSNDRLKNGENGNVMNFTFESKQGYKNINSAQLYSTPICTNQDPNRKQMI